MLPVTALLLVLILFGTRFTDRSRWIVAVVFAVLWRRGGERVRRHRFAFGDVDRPHPTLVSRATGTRVVGMPCRAHACANQRASRSAQPLVSLLK